MRYTLATIIASVLLVGCDAAGGKGTPKEKAVLEWNGARASVLSGLAADQYKARDFEKCHQTVAQALKLVPDNVQLRILSAKLAIEEGQLETADEQLKLVRKAVPENSEALFLSGVVCQRWQQLDAARDYYHRASAQSPGELDYVLAESEMLVALGHTEAALALLRGKVAYFEHSGAIRDAVGQLLMQLGRPAEAVASIREASVLCEDDQGIRERLARAQFVTGDNRGCAESLARLLTLPTFAGRADLFAMLGMARVKLGDPRAARESFEAATRTDPSLAMAFRGLARTSLECGDSRRAEAAAARAVALDAADAESHMLLGYTRFSQGRYAEALPSLYRASELNPSDPTTACLLGCSLNKLGRRHEATEQFNRALRAAPGDELARRLVASD